MIARLSVPAVLAGLIPLIAHAAEPARQEPVQLQADRIEIDQKSGLSRYRGHVVLTQGDLRLTADRAEVQHNQNQLETVVAHGRPVTFRDRLPGQNEFIEGKALRAEYQALERRLHLYGEVDLKRGADRVRAAEIHYDMNSEAVQAESDGNQRAIVTVQPRRQEPPGDKVAE